jgi:hypothetical protein
MDSGFAASPRPGMTMVADGAALFRENFGARGRAAAPLTLALPPEMDHHRGQQLITR